MTGGVECGGRGAGALGLDTAPGCLAGAAFGYAGFVSPRKLIRFGCASREFTTEEGVLPITGSAPLRDRAEIKS